LFFLVFKATSPSMCPSAVCAAMARAPRRKGPRTIRANDPGTKAAVLAACTGARVYSRSNPRRRNA
jgi:hypothetical protein